MPDYATRPTPNYVWDYWLKAWVMPLTKPGDYIGPTRASREWAQQMRDFSKPEL